MARKGMGYCYSSSSINSSNRVAQIEPAVAAASAVKEGSFQNGNVGSSREAMRAQTHVTRCVRPIF